MLFKSLKSYILVFFILISTTLEAQFSLYRDTLVKVMVGGNELNNGWACGLNSPVFASIDLNGDGKNDLLVFDAQTYRLSAFENSGSTGVSNFKYAPEYLSICPDNLQGWIRTFDYDNDGDLDLLLVNIAPIYDEGFIRRYRNEGNGVFTEENILGSLSIEHGEAQWGDYDGDGDLDILVAGNLKEVNGSLTPMALRLYRFG